MTPDETSMLGMFTEAMKRDTWGLTVRSMTAFIFSQKPSPRRESGKDWNSHYVQAELSRLTGRGLIKARKMDKGNALLYTLPPPSPLFNEVKNAMESLRQ